MPQRLLYGLLPSALLGTHHFWQDTASDMIRGYPRQKKNSKKKRQENVPSGADTEDSEAEDEGEDEDVDGNDDEKKDEEEASEKDGEEVGASSPVKTLGKLSGDSKKQQHLITVRMVPVDTVFATGEKVRLIFSYL